MKRKFIALLLFLGIILYGFYFYLYQNRRDITAEKASYTLTVANLQKEFSQNNEASNKKYLDETIAIEGVITNIDDENHSVTLDEKVYAVFNDSILKNVALQKKVKLKGRFIGYDDLLDEFKIDQASISE